MHVSAPVVGIVCEYDPFHLGHRRQFELIRQALPGARIVCVMSGCFTQRGMPALHAPQTRAEAALRAGADLVLELPCAFAVSHAERFALGGVALLSALGFVTHLSFGAEDALETLLPAAALLEAPTPAYEKALREALSQGMAMAAARGRALARCLGAQDVWQRPNNILALCYLRAIARLNSPLRPLAVKRAGAYHDAEITPGVPPSATAVRSAFLRGEYALADAACGYALPRAPVCPPYALDLPLLHKLRSMPPEALAALPGCGEGLENRLHASARRATSREALLALIKTRRYPYARLNRLCCHALLGVDEALFAEAPAPRYARLLGLRASSGLTAALRESAIPVVAKAARGDEHDPLYRLDERAYDLWALGAGVPAGLMMRQRVVAVP